MKTVSRVKSVESSRWRVALSSRRRATAATNPRINDDTRPACAGVTADRQLAILAAKLAHKKKAKDVVILNMAKTPLQIADYFLIASGTNKKQNQAIAEEISNKFTPLSVQGTEEGSWIVVDLGSVVVHIMHEQLRKFYDLEFIWQEAPRVRMTNV